MRAGYEAPTVFVHAPAWSAVAGPGPALPAEAFTRIPAPYALRNACSTASEYAFAPPLIEKFRTSTPSAIAWLTAATLSDWKHPRSRQTRYAMTQAPGAIPLVGPR